MARGTRPKLDKTMSIARYQGDLAYFLEVEVPKHAFAPSRYMVALLERLADDHDEIERLRGIVSHQDAKLVEGSVADGTGVKDA